MKKSEIHQSNPHGWDYHYAIAIDYDNTINVNGHIREDMVKFIKKYKQKGCIMILWTSRCDAQLEEAIHACAEKGVYFDYINENPLRYTSVKANADIYIDDRADPSRRIRLRPYIKAIDKALKSGKYVMKERF